MSTLALRTNDHFGKADSQTSSSGGSEHSSSTLSQRIRALEGAGITDTFIKKRIPAYAAVAAAIGSELQQNGHTKLAGSSTKIYQNPSNFDSLAKAPKHIDTTELNDKPSNNSFHQIYRSTSMDSIDENASNGSVRIEDMIKENKVTSPVNCHTIIEELNAQKTKLKKVSQTHLSSNNSEFGKVVPNVGESLPPPVNINTSFSQATSRLIAESLKKIHSNSTNEIPISIALSGASRSSSPGAASALIGVFHEVTSPSRHQDLTPPTPSIKTYEHSSLENHYKLINTSPRPYVPNHSKQSSIDSISCINYPVNVNALKNIAQEVFEHSGKPDADDSVSINSFINDSANFNSKKNSIINEEVVGYQSSTLYSHVRSDEPRKSSIASTVESSSDMYSKYTFNLLSKTNTTTATAAALLNNHSTSSSSNDLLATTPFRAPSYEQLDSTDYLYNRPLTANYLKKNNSTAYDDYLTGQSNNNNNNLSSLDTNRNSNSNINNNNNNNDINKSTNENENNTRSHLVSIKVYFKGLSFLSKRINHLWTQNKDKYI